MSNSPIDREHWSRVAREWIEWARSPGHDAFWAYHESLVNVVGPGDGEALHIGCGEGQVSRMRLTALPFGDSRFDMIVACNVPMDLENVEARRSAMGYRCISLDGRRLWKPMRPLWRARGWQLRPSASLFRTMCMDMST